MIEKLKSLKFTPHLMLPLAGVSWFSIHEQFVDAWLSRDRQHLLVSTTVKIPALDSRRQRNAEYLGTRTDGTHLYRLAIPEEYWITVEHFIHGRYTKFTDRARRLIFDLSGLRYRLEDPTTNMEETHVLLTAITDPAKCSVTDVHHRQELARMLSEDLYGDPTVMDWTGELLSAPTTREEVFYPG